MIANNVIKINLTHFFCPSIIFYFLVSLRSLLHQGIYYGFCTGVLTIVLVFIAINKNWLLFYMKQQKSDTSLYTPDIQVYTDQDVNDTRTNLVKFIFGTETLPDILPEESGDQFVVEWIQNQVNFKYSETA